ncbi:MAG TPA: low affinity iron permease family protein [Terriglobia bacterium]|nr:low affinity iron permease family protein [Terriglobia bacterium]
MASKDTTAKESLAPLETISRKVTEWTGSSTGFASALLISIAWAVSGPFFHYSNAWQLVINTITNVATFLMVFIIQRSQNKDAMAINIKLNELIAAIHGARNILISAENLSEAELKDLQESYQHLLEIAQRKRKQSEVSDTEDHEEPPEQKRAS